MINKVIFKNKANMLFKRNREPIQTIKTNSNDIALDFKLMLEKALKEVK